jgi:hypothetical protein
MVTQKYIRQNRKLAGQESPAESAARSATQINETIEISNLNRVQSECVIDSLEAHDRPLAGFEESSKTFEIYGSAGKVSASLLPSVRRIDPFEESLYWLLSAAVLSYLLFVIISF